jgi:cytochrome c553
MGQSKGIRSIWAAALLAGGLALAVGARADAPAGDAARGAKVAYTCLGCHGIPDYRNAYPNYRVPKLGGQHAAYLAAALGEYRAGARPHPTMRGQAGSISEQDVRDVAAYFATPTPVASSGKGVGTPPAAATTCVACHGPDGVGILPDYPTLAGQHADYLEQALKAYRGGKRQNPIMNGMAASLKDEDIRELAAYFAKQGPSLWVPLPGSAVAAR